MPPRTKLIVPLLLLLAAAALAADFYEQQLQIAKIDFAAGRTVQAADELRIAAFGFLDRPPLLTEALVRLALAQLALGQTSLVTQTLGRFIDVEQRFGTYPALPLEPAMRSKFDALLVSNMSPQTLKSISSLAKLVKTPAEAAADLPQRQRIAAYEAGSRREPQNIDWPLAAMRFYAAGGEQGDIAKWAQKVLNLDPKNVEARSLLLHAYEARGDCANALKTFAAFTPADLQAHPDVYADQGVCLVQGGKFAEAKAAFARISDVSKSRADVRKAIEQLTARDTAAAAAAARDASSTAAKQTAETPKPVPARPPATAVVGRPSSATSTMASMQQPKARSVAEVLAETHALIQKGKFGEAAQQIRIALQNDPGSRPLRVAMLEAAVLSKEWRTAVAQVAATAPYATGEELSMFYAAVALYESGRQEEAKPLMERARPRMVSSPMVDFYINAVLQDSQ